MPMRNANSTPSDTRQLDPSSLVAYQSAYRRDETFQLGGCAMQHDRQRFGEEPVSAFDDDVGWKAWVTVDRIHHASTRSHI